MDNGIMQKLKNVCLKILLGVLSPEKAPSWVGTFSGATPQVITEQTFFNSFKFTLFKRTFRRHCAGEIFTFLLIAGLGLSGLFADDRPLRSMPPDEEHLEYYSSLVISHSTSAIANSLLTEENLQQPLTQQYIAQYTSPSGITHLNDTMARANIYLPFIREEVKKRGLPPELVYLPVIESSFVVTARSRSGAVGLWQFMLNSISPFNIKVDDYIDERRDFIKSTRAAILKLEDNYRTLGNWELALAAYNAGLGAVSRMVQRTGARNYWELSRRREFTQETEHYVPKLIAAAWVLSQPRRFGINVWQAPFEWVEIPLQRQVSLDELSREAGLDRDLLGRLNAQYLYGITPMESGFCLVIPKDSYEQVNQVLQREDIRLVRYYYHVVHQGDTLWSMSRHYGVSLSIIEQHNPGISSRYLRVGETVIVPAYQDAAPYPRAAVNYVFNGTHTVARGETLWSIGQRYGVDPQVLAEENDMELTQILREGRVLKVPIID